jgi:PIN domain nuclease of toxin-antitoxin system
MIFVANETRLDPEADHVISEAAYDGRLYVSPISAWEIGVGVAKGRLSLPLAPLDFFEKFVERMQAKLSPVSQSIMIASSFLPGEIHGDPMDRILVSTARNLDLVLVTRDRPILAYGREGHVRTLAC